VARDDRGAAEPGINRDRFLSEFALALVEEPGRSNRVKDDFVANLSHEIRTPVR
jgi:signal transduction histidine kinase